jgi:uncharacterized protein (TIGR03067 family)
MANFSTRSSLLACLIFLLAVPTRAEPPTPGEVDRLIRQLGSPSFREREAAAERLRGLGEAALDALREAAENNPDAEIRLRADGLLAALGPKGLQGTWTVVAGEMEGVPVPSDLRQGAKLTITKDTLTFTWPQADFQGVCQLEPAGNPPTVDVAQVSGGAVVLRKALRGIYVRERQRLSMCFSFSSNPQERPAKFATASGSQSVLLVFERGKAPK